MIFYVYVVSGYNILRGVLPLRKLLIAGAEDQVSTIMNTSLTVINAKMTQEEVNNLFRKTKFLAIPVVDDAYRLMGTVTLEKAVDDIAMENADEFLGSKTAMASYDCNFRAYMRLYHVFL
jgi:magnesium transporter